MWGFGLIGPLAGWELRRLARRGLAQRVRLVLLAVLFLVFVVFAAGWFYPLPVRDVFVAPQRMLPADAARFADTFSLVLLEAQLVAVVALAPALAASAVSEEKDRQTLQLLLTTELTDREIVFGKAAGRTAFVLAAVLCGVPVLSLTLLFGGVSIGFLAAGYALIAGTTALCSAIGVSAACRSPDLRSAVVRAYWWVFVLVCGCFVPWCLAISPFGILARVSGESDLAPAAVGLYAVVQLAIAWVLLVSAARALRLREPSAGPPPVSIYPLPPRPAAPPLIQPERPAPRSLPPLDDSDPVLWKERVAGFRPSWGVPTLARALGAIGTALVVILFARGAWELRKRIEWSLQPEAPQTSTTPDADPSGWLLMGAGVFAAGRYLFPLSVGLSGVIAGERFRGTLDALLATPLSRRAVLRAKVQAHVERGLGFATAAAAGTGMAFTADGGVQLGVAAAILVLAGIGLVIGAGAWLTVRSASDARAFRVLVRYVVLVVGWPVGAWTLLLRSDAGVTAEELSGWLFAASGACGVLGLALWWHAGRTLERGE